MTIQSKTTSYLSILSILNVGALIVYVIFFLSIKDKNEHISTLKNSVEESLALENANTAVEKILADTEKKRETLNSFLVSKDGIVSFLEKIEHLGVTTNTSVKVDSVNENLSKDGGPTYFAVDLSARGSWSGVYEVLHSLENLPNKVVIADFSLDYDLKIDEKGKETGSRMWKGNFSITVLQSK